MAHVHVAGHSVELEARVGGATFRTRFGLLRIIVPGSLPETMASALASCPVDGIVDHALTRGWDCRVAGIEVRSGELGIACRIGNFPYRRP